MWKVAELTEVSKGIFSKHFYGGQVFCREYEYMPGRKKVLITPRIAETSVKVLSAVLAKNFYNIVGDTTPEQQEKLIALEQVFVNSGRL
jgi:hypothetical protein